MEKLFNCKKSEDMSDRIYLDKFNDIVWALKHSGIFMNVSSLIINKEHGDINE